MTDIIVNEASLAPYEDKMKIALKVLEEDFNTIRAGRANPRILDKITVNYYGVDSPLNQVANIQVPEARMITIQPWESNMVKEIERALNMSDLGINPQNDGKVIRLVFPQLTEERRKELAREVSQMGEGTKVSIRNVRREGIDIYRGYQKQNKISEDELYNFEQDMQTLTNKYTDEVDKAVAKKEKELMEI
ncbi:MAG TPA: ribosome recycling factor [Clostridiaceae bacterium]|nr:ribosome recycling factor [Clostridiaceae bacterium]